MKKILKLPPSNSSSLFLPLNSFSSSSSSSSSQIHLIKPQIQKSFFKSNPGENKFRETIATLCQQNRLGEAIQLLDNVNQLPASTYSTLLQLCLQRKSLLDGKMVHAHIKNSDFKPGIFISNRIIDMYVKCDSLVHARQVFDEMVERDLCSWNTIINGYAKAGKIEEARKLFNEMPEKDSFSWTAMVSCYVKHDMAKEGLELFRSMQRNGNGKCSKFTVSSVLAASSAMQCLRFGKEIHGHIVRSGLDSDAVVWSALSDMYGKCGSLDEARRVFDRTLERDVVSWTAMIDRYFEDGRKEEGFTLFSGLLRSGIRPNEFTFAGVLNTCADHAVENFGREVHAHMVRLGFDPVSFAASALVHMYSKCGNVECAKRVFNGMPKPDLVSWTSLIAGYAQNGEPNKALEFFELLLKSGMQPDHVTFVGVLSACAHAGLVDKGLEYFHSITEKHGLKHTPDHYSCVIDLLARSGRFKEAEDIINKMPVEPDRFLWASLLGGCRVHGNLELAERAAEALFKIEPENPATYVTMANIYATAGKWSEVARIRKLMDDRGLVKKPGLSWVEIKRQVYVFLVGDNSHPKSKEIHDYLKKMSTKMMEEGYVPNTNFVLHDVEEEQKEQNLSYHSEKLAVAFGIISTPPGTPLKIFKNLRTCVDCHTAIKFISKIAQRRIIVRDSNRFHCFENGSCSCGDYW